jgi:streptomycin 3"-adenylyltransferase
VQGTLGEVVVAAYLHGSAVLGGLRPRSDLDVLVVLRRPTSRDEKRRLVDGLLTISGTGTRRPVELTIVVESEIRPWRYPPSMDFQYGEWLRDDFENGELEPFAATNPDLAVLVTMLLNANRPLLGPAPAAVLEPPPRTDLVSAMAAGVEGLLHDLDSDTRNVLLTFARIWCTLATGDIRAKDDAASWALQQLPIEHRDVLARARAIYLGDDEERWDDVRSRLRPHVDYVLAEIGRLVEAEARTT